LKEVKQAGILWILPLFPIVHHNKSQEGISCVGGQIADDSGKIKQTFFKITQ
jgi:hypothetical protein